MGLILGTDDAGRGPVIGPMVISGVVIDEKDLAKLSAIGVKDSKLLTPKRREEIYDKIIKTVKDCKIVIIPPKEIDEAVESETTNLNWLEGQKFAIIINALKPDMAIVDCPSTNTQAFTDYLRKFLKSDVKLKCEHKADLRFVVVGAASILSKVTRDREIEKIKTKIGVDFGSGYPADPKTQTFLKKYWNKFPEIFRHSWSTYKNVSGEKKQKKLGEF